MIAVVLLGSSFVARAVKAAVRVEDWGKTPAGETVTLFTLADDKVRVRVTEYGARIGSIEAPDRQGKEVDIVLGYNNLAQRTANPAQYFGAVAGRYANRIDAGTFARNGEVFHVPLNRGGNALLKLGGGYDHNYVLRGEAGKLREAARVIDPVSGRTLTVLTTQPGMQFYSSNFLNGTVKGYSGRAYEKYGAFCVETQHFPDSPNHPNFPTTTLQPGRTMHSTTVFVFGTTPAS